MFKNTLIFFDEVIFFPGSLSVITSNLLHCKIAHQLVQSKITCTQQAYDVVSTL